MSKAKKNPTIVTPAGTLAYPWLNRPDAKFDPKKPVYKTNLILDKNDPQVQNLLATLDQLADEAVKAETEALLEKAKTPADRKKIKVDRAAPYVPEEDEEGNETGNVILRFKMLAQYEDEKTGKIVQLKPMVVDSKNNKIDLDKTNIGAGTTAQVAFRPDPYYTASSKTAGISLRIQGIRVLNLVKFEGGANAAAMFGAAVDGYTDEGDSDSQDSGETESNDPGTGTEEDF